MYHPFIVGEKLYLRGIEKADLSGDMTQWANDSDVTQYMVMGAVPNSGSIYCSWNNLEEEYEKLMKSKTDVVFAIVDKKSDLMIGIAGLYDISWIPRSAEFRIAIGEKKFWGKGFGTEATNLIVTYAFEKLNLNQVHLGVNAEDERANKCYKKVGFFLEGTKREQVYRNGRYYDVNFYSILRSEKNRKQKKQDNV